MIKKLICALSENPAIFCFLRKVIEFNFVTIKRVIQKEFGVIITDPGKLILDVPCGTGEFSPLFPEEGYTGIDISPRYIDYALRHYKKMFYCRDACNNGFKEAYFDLVLIIGFFHHLDMSDIEKALHEVRRVLKPGGRVLLIEDAPVKSSWDFISRILQSQDVGSNIRSSDVYKAILQKHFFIQRYYPIRNAFWDYSVFVLLNN